MSLRRRPAWSWTAARGAALANKQGESPCVEGARRQGRRSSATAEATGGRREVNASNQNIRCAIEQIKSNLWQPEYLLSYPRLGSLLGPLRTLPRMGGAAEGQTGRAPHLGSGGAKWAGVAHGKAGDKKQLAIITARTRG
jgi:hypothetical protein